MAYSLDSLADAVNAWCTQHRVTPANGQAATELSVRTLRYYRTVNLLDAPASGGGAGYGERHFLQACAVRVLQAEGLPLNRIQSLLFGRSDGELQSVIDAAAKGTVELPSPNQAPLPAQPESWQTWPLGSDFLLISRKPGVHLSPEETAAILDILARG
jgi:DNA-binding transcriptional MerR regulator